MSVEFDTARVLGEGSVRSLGDAPLEGVEAVTEVRQLGSPSKIKASAVEATVAPYGRELKVA